MGNKCRAKMTLHFKIGRLDSHSCGIRTSQINSSSNDNCYTLLAYESFEKFVTVIQFGSLPL